MRIDDEGRVGIGTASPQTLLDVGGTIRFADGGETCTGTIEGAQRYNASEKRMEICDGDGWLPIGSGDSSDGGGGGSGSVEGLRFVQKDGFPDYIVCTVGTTRNILQATRESDTSVQYWGIYGLGSYRGTRVTFNSNGDFVSSDRSSGSGSTGWSSSCSGQSIDDLYADGQAFNFVGGNSVGSSSLELDFTTVGDWNSVSCPSGTDLVGCHLGYTSGGSQVCGPARSGNTCTTSCSGGPYFVRATCYSGSGSGGGGESLWTANDTDIHFSGGSVGIGTTSPAARLDVDGGIKAANDGEACTSSKAGTIRWTGAAFEGCDGSSWTSLTGGEGPASCPAGFTIIGSSGAPNTFCIDTNERTDSDWLSAKQTCHNLSTTRGAAHLCGHNEWYEACDKGGLTGMTGNWEWVSDVGGMGSNRGALVAGLSNCSSVGSNTISTTYTFRCCIR